MAHYTSDTLRTLIARILREQRGDLLIELARAAENHAGYAESATRDRHPASAAIASAMSAAAHGLPPRIRAGFATCDNRNEWVLIASAALRVNNESILRAPEQYPAFPWIVSEHD